MWLSTLHGQHRLVMAQKLGRCLEPCEVVPYINKVRSDNRFENLKLLPKQSTHLPYALSENENKRLTKEAEDLKSQMRLLIGILCSFGMVILRQIQSNLINAPG